MDSAVGRCYQSIYPPHWTLFLMLPLQALRPETGVISRLRVPITLGTSVSPRSFYLGFTIHSFTLFVAFIALLDSIPATPEDNLPPLERARRRRANFFTPRT